MQSQRIPGLALVVTQGDEIIYLQGYGQDMTPQTQFFIASVSKSFTALAVMQLFETGEIDLDRPVQTYLPHFTTADPDAAADITVRHLLNQTSGLADTGFPEAELPQPDSISERVSSLRTAEIVSEPGTAFHYFNPNYGVLARIVEVVSGQSFEDYLQANVFSPLEMSNTYSTITSDEVKARATDLAQGHLLVYGVPLTVDEMSGYLAGSSGVISTAEDMAHFLIMQNHGGRYEDASLISPDSLTLMHTPPQGIDSNYAMGWLTSEHNGVSTIEHNGILSVYYTEVVLLPETGHGFVLLYNVNSLPSTLFAFPQIKNGLIDLLTGQQPSTSPMTVPLYGIIMGIVTLIGTALALRSLLRLPTWRAKHHATPLIRLLPGILWTFAPVFLLLMIPRLFAFSGRVFSTEQLFRFMPEFYIWLGITGVLGVINGLMRVYLHYFKKGEHMR